MQNLFTKSIFLDSNAYDDSKKLFIKIDFRKIESFFDFENSEFFPNNSLQLRFLDFTIFEGNSFQSKYVNSLDNMIEPTYTFSFSSSGKLYMLHISSFFGPHDRLQFIAALSELDEKLKFKNFKVNLSNNFTLIPIATSENCLHEFEPGKCLICESDYQLDEKTYSCVLCPSNSVYVDIFNKCLTPKKSPGSLNIKKDFHFENTYNLVDPFNLGNQINIMSTVFSHFTNNSISSFYTKEDMNFSKTIDLKDNLVHISKVIMKFKVADNRYVDPLYFGIYFNNQSSIADSSISNQYQIDYGTLKYDGSNYYKKFKFYSTIFSDSGSKNFSHSSIFMNLIIGGISDLEEIAESKKYSFEMQEIISELKDSKDYPKAKIYPVSFPIKTFSNSKHLYIPYGLLKYYAIELNGQKGLLPPHGFYYEFTNNFYYTRSCSENCSNCSSFKKCLNCSKGYFLRDGSCFACNFLCSECETTALNCLNKNELEQSKLDQKCEPGLYWDNIFQKCEFCPTKCTECTSPFRCTKCHLWFKFDKYQCKPTNLCDHPDQNNGNQSSLCINCPENCLFCDNKSSICSKCKNGYFLDYNNCAKCSNNCSFCTNNNVCDLCNYGYYLKNGQCNPTKNKKEIKGDGSKLLFFFQNREKDYEEDNDKKLGQNDSNSKILEYFEKGCLLLSKENKQKCIICLDGYFLGNDFKCHSCSLYCFKCISEEFCIKCQNDFQLDFVQNLRKMRCVLKKVKNLLN